MESKKVLIIDDDELSYFSISLAARSDFFEVLPQASNSLKALQAIDNSHPDIILMDVRLDSAGDLDDSTLFTDGIEFAHYLNEHYEIPIIFVTGFSDFETVSRSISKDFYGILSKPVDKVTLQTALLSALLRFQQDMDKRKQESMVNMFFDHNMFGYFLASYPPLNTKLNLNINKLIESTRIERVNETLLQLIGAERDEVIQKQLSELFDLDEVAIQPAIEQLIKRGLYQGRLTLKKKNGETFIADVYCKRVNYLEENRQVLLGMIRDITEQVKAQTELEMLVPAVADIKESVIVTTSELVYPHPKIIYVNRAACEMTGYSREELLNQSPRILQGPLTDKKVIEKLSENLKNGQPFQGRNVNYRKDGSTYIVEWNITPVKNQQGEVDFFVSVQRDITKEVSMIQRIERDKELFQAMLNNSRIAKFLVNEEHEVLISNEFSRNLIKKLTNKTFDVSETPPIESLFPEKYREILTNALSKASHYTFNKFEIEFTIANQTRIFEFTCRKIGGSSTVNDVQFLLTGFDITEIRRANTELKEMNKQLEEMVEERTKEYKQAKEEAIESARVKERFLANMSHEIRTPINGIRGMVHLLQDTLLNQVQKEYLETIRVSSDSLLVIINDILDIEKIESGKLELEKNPFELSNIAQNAQRLLQPKAKEKHIPLYFDSSNLDQNMLVGDTARIQQIVLNLVDNAIKFTSDGEVFVRFISRKISKDLAEITIYVKDSGIGMSEEQKKRIFNPFVQADPTINRRFGGTGLGLSISKRLLEMMNGTIEVKSEKGKGSEFKVQVRLPIWNGELPKENSSIEAVDYSGYHFILVDDNKVNLLFLKRLLDKWNIDSDSVESGLLAIDLIRNKKYDLLFLDIQMPEMDGYEVSRFIRNELKLSSADLPIVAITADVLTDQKQKMIEAGIDGLITKPFDPKDIKSYIEKLLVSKKHKKANEKKLGLKHESLLKFDTLDEMAADDFEFRLSVIEQFHQVLIDTIEKLPYQINPFNTKQVRMLIHRIKPNAGYFGLDEMVEMCKKIMTITSQEQFEEERVIKLIHQVQDYMIRAEKDVSLEMQNLREKV